MPLREIDRSRWSEFLRGFARQHEDWLVAVSTDVALDTGAGLQPLSDVRLEDGARRVVVEVGRPDQISRFEVDRPVRVLFDETAEGAHSGLAVEGERGDLRLRFRVAMQPELVDGVM